MAIPTDCENAVLYGAAPERDEFDTREIWDEDDALAAVAESFRILAQGVGPDGFQLADERESLLWGFANMLDSQTQRLDRAADKLMSDLRDLQRGQDGTEIKPRELEFVTDRAQNLTARRDAFERMRDEATTAYRVETGSTWRPRRGSHVSQTGKLTSAAIAGGKDIAEGAVAAELQLQRVAAAGRAAPAHGLRAIRTEQVRVEAILDRRAHGLPGEAAGLVERRLGRVRNPSSMPFRASAHR